MLYCRHWKGTDFSSQSSQYFYQTIHYLLSIFTFWLLFPLFQNRSLSKGKDKSRKGRGGQHRREKLLVWYQHTRQLKLSQKAITASR